MRRFFFLFIDGLGMGPDSSVLIEQMLGFPRDPRSGSCGPWTVHPVDACLGVPGLPQSATGQTTLLSGINAARLLGHHHNAFPPRRLIDLLGRYNLFHELQKAGVPCAGGNLYSRKRSREKRRKSVTTHALLRAGVPLLFDDRYEEHAAVCHDLRNRSIRETTPALPEISPATAAHRLLRLTKTHPFVFFEYFLTDRHGHKQDSGALSRSIADLGILCRELRESFISDQHALLIVSDHGNCEDLSRKTHTLNPVPLILGGGPDWLRRSAQRVQTIQGVPRLCLDYFTRTVNTTVSPSYPK